MPQYKVYGYGEKTNRQRKRIYYAYDEKEAREKALHDETIPETIEMLPEESATDRQISYARSLGKNIDENYTKREASDIISRVVDHDEPACEEIKEIADYFKVEYSQYANEYSLFNSVHNILIQSDKKENVCSWFLSRVYHKLFSNHSGKSKPPWDPTISEIASEIAQDESVYRSICRYEGDELVFFGEKTFEDGWVHTGGSIQTKAYKRAKELLKNYFPELNQSTKKQKNNNSSKYNLDNERQKDQPNKTYNKKSLDFLLISGVILLLIFIIANC